MAKFLGKVEFPCTIQQGRGLEGAITNITQIGYVDGQAGRLVYRGCGIEDLCEHGTFEEVAYLLIFGRLPNRSELSSFRDKLRSRGRLPEAVKTLITSMPKTAHPMNVLQAAVAAAGGYDEQAVEVTRHVSDPAEAVATEMEVAIRVMAQTSTIGAAIARARNGQALVEPDPELSFTENFLHMMTGEPPNEVMARVMDVCLILQADHGMNASTFTSMVVHSSMSDLYSTIAAAIGSLRGPLHGGANELALADMQSIDGPGAAAAWVADRLAHHGKIIGFGHRVYKAYDPRARILKRYAETLCRDKGLDNLFQTADAVEREVCATMDKAGKNIFPNVDFYSGIVYHALGFATPMFPVIFAVARTAGWVSRVLEYLPINRIFRPRAVYNGATDARYVPMSER